jgi:aryl-alcohol dehydrogenase-like predicted oxidoreductase
VNTRKIGNRTVSAIGLGAMPLSIEGRPDRGRAIATVHAALDAGVDFIDTADAYTMDADGPGHNEVLIAEALASYPGDTSGVLVATKGGLNHLDWQRWPNNGSPDHLREAAHASRQRLGVEAIGLYQYHQPDPAWDFAESMGAIRALLDDGVILQAGVSNVTVDQIEVAQEVLGGRLVSVQNRFSPVYRKSMPELEYCGAHGIAFLPWSPLGGIGNGEKVFAEQQAFADVAAELGVSPQQVTLAWELALGEHVIPIPGCSRPASIADSARAPELELTSEQLARLSASHPATSARR